MCGIAGVISQSREVVVHYLESLTRSLSHRGPDGSGTSLHQVDNSWVGLGHTRLAILDLSDAAQQPMTDPRTGNVISYNGEIYNFEQIKTRYQDYPWRSSGDTEVVLRHLSDAGKEQIDQLHGMYALAYLDINQQSLLLARDPLGIKPLYLYQSQTLIAFCSEFQPLRRQFPVSTRITRECLTRFLRTGSIKQIEGLHPQIRMIAQSELISVSVKDESLQVDTIPRRTEHTPSSEPRAERVRTLLEDSVARHLISDVPVALLLSSGIDSTILAYLARSQRQSLRAFTISWGNQDQREVAWAANTARDCQIPHTVIEFQSQSIESSIVNYLQNLDLPSMDGLNTYLICQQIRAEGFRVALSGLGADELFGGYPTFQDLRRYRHIQNLIRILPGLHSVLTHFSHWMTTYDKLCEFLIHPRDLLSSYEYRRRLFSDRLIARLGLGHREGDQHSQPSPSRIPLPDYDTISRFELSEYLTHQLLRDTDECSMRSSIELRVPYLDHALVNTVMNFRNYQRSIPGKPPKWLLVEACRDLLPHHLICRVKTGFTLPLREWILGPILSLTIDYLDQLKNTGLFLSTGIDQIWQEFLRYPSVLMTNRVWALVTLSAYLKNQDHARPA
jgi:asparagine synthase (glutamine-hydrolysing)